ncbi:MULTISPECIES: sigma-54-dependent Fis family transcriptional regulator [unclassified Thioalkalivibrio]|uniref:sigma-54 interaction domain-containing protein n=1 Tax=unclassified Thioalkalivibrio TaxID=2621013 RepID=UPI00037DD76F|nr:MULTISPECIES: sigma 54-interacting transcriptional regulator [unclassified Thioalkalivibrio]
MKMNRGEGLPDAFRSADPDCHHQMVFARRAAGSDIRMLLLGESGTGKTRLARGIHEWSPRAAGPFVEVNCAAIPDELLESELFGHVRGAFSGAVNDREGRFESAHGGTLFLDEIGELPLRLQAKLLRAVQDGQFERVGENTTRQVDVRILSASNQDLQARVDAGQFRADLFYRLAVATVELPPLRTRPRDLAATLDRFVEEHALQLAPALRRKLEAHPWPGNFRELENVFACLQLHAVNGRVEDFPLPEGRPPGTVSPQPEAAAPATAFPEGPPTDAAPQVSPRESEEARRLRQALAAHNGNRSRAARSLGIDRTTLWRKLHRYNLA